MEVIIMQNIQEINLIINNFNGNNQIIEIMLTIFKNLISNNFL